MRYDDNVYAGVCVGGPLHGEYITATPSPHLVALVLREVAATETNEPVATDEVWYRWYPLYGGAWLLDERSAPTTLS